MIVIPSSHAYIIRVSLRHLKASTELALTDAIASKQEADMLRRSLPLIEAALAALPKESV